MTIHSGAAFLMDLTGFCYSEIQQNTIFCDCIKLIIDTNAQFYSSIYLYFLPFYGGLMSNSHNLQSTKVITRHSSATKSCSHFINYFLRPIGLWYFFKKLQSECFSVVQWKSELETRLKDPLQNNFDTSVKRRSILTKALGQCSKLTDSIIGDKSRYVSSTEKPHPGHSF